MTELSTAIMTKFNATSGDPAVNNTFYTSIGGRLYNTQAPQAAIFPFAVFTEISDLYEFTFTTSFENILFQFALFSTEESVQEVENMFSYCKTLFDWCTLSPSGYTHLYMRRESSHLTKDDRPAWMRIVEYRIMCED